MPCEGFLGPLARPYHLHVPKLGLPSRAKHDRICVICVICGSGRLPAPIVTEAAHRFPPPGRGGKPARGEYKLGDGCWVKQGYSEGLDCQAVTEPPDQTAQARAVGRARRVLPPDSCFVAKRRRHFAE